MAHTYCPSCGEKTEYGTKMPQFCGWCRHPLTSVAARKVETYQKQPAYSEEIEEDDDLVSDVDDILGSVSLDDSWTRALSKKREFTIGDAKAQGPSRDPIGKRPQVKFKEMIKRVKSGAKDDPINGDE